MMTTWLMVSTILSAIGVTCRASKRWECGSIENQTGSAIAVILIVVPAIYVFGWLFLPMVLGH